MYILVLNCGSSSIKYQLIDTDKEKIEKNTEKVFAKGLVERIGSADAKIKHKANGKEKVIDMPIYEHKVGIQKVLELLTDPEVGVIKDVNEIAAVGHRVVHGGELFSKSCIITKKVEKGIEDCIELAPLHNPPNLMGYRAAKEIMPKTPQVAVFDTAFHQSMPDYAYFYALPYSLYEKYKIRRYGFHGTSHRFVSWRIGKLLGKDWRELKIITCHLGNGSSIAAINKGKSVDTTMGFTPLEGLVMGTRCGDIDPAIVPFLMEKEELRVEEINNMLNKFSGVLGISGISNDMRIIEEKMQQGDYRCTLAFKIMAYRIKKYIGAYMAVMNGADVIIFTAGIGENSPLLREEVCKNMEFLGIKLDKKKNNETFKGKEGCISTPDSKVKVYVIPTNEELLIARDAYFCVIEKKKK